MTNLFNSRSAWSPQGRNLLNVSGWEDERDEMDDRRARGSAYDAGMPVFRPGEVSSDPEPWSSARASGPPEPPAPVAPVPDAQESYENGLQEIRPFVSIGGKESFPYLKSMFGRTLGEIAGIAEAQYPGATVRTGVTGRPIITMPPEATQWRPYPSPSWGDAGPEFAMEGVPIGGQEFQLDAPGVTLRDVANGGGQTAYEVGNAFSQAGRGAKAGMYTGWPGAAIAGAVIGAAKGYYEADRKIGEHARTFKARSER